MLSTIFRREHERRTIVLNLVTHRKEFHLKTTFFGETILFLDLFFRRERKNSYVTDRTFLPFVQYYQTFENEVWQSVSEQKLFKINVLCYVSSKGAEQRIEHFNNEDFVDLFVFRRIIPEVLSISFKWK